MAFKQHVLMTSKKVIHIERVLGEKKRVVFLLRCVFCCFSNVFLTVYVDESDALSFLRDKRVYKQFKTKCEEQKREAKAAYEARCEPSIHVKLTRQDPQKKRYCPDLQFWNDFKKYEVQ